MDLTPHIESRLSLLQNKAVKVYALPVNWESGAPGISVTIGDHISSVVIYFPSIEALDQVLSTIQKLADHACNDDKGHDEVVMFVTPETPQRD